MSHEEHNLGDLQIDQVLVAVALSPASVQVFRSAYLFAKEYGARLHVLHSCYAFEDSLPYYAEEYLLRLRTEHFAQLPKMAEEALNQFVEEQDCEGVAISQKVESEGPVDRKILEYAEEVSADLIVVGTHGRKGMSRLTLGSVADNTLRNASCPVFIVRGEKFAKQGDLPSQVKRVVVCTDFSERGDDAMKQGLGFAKRLNAQVDLVHVVDPVLLSTIGTFNSQVLASEYREELMDEARKKFDSYISEYTDAKEFLDLHIVSGPPAQEIIATAKKANDDLVILGRHGHGILKDLFLGSTAERVAHDIHCPVLVIK